MSDIAGPLNIEELRAVLKEEGYPDDSYDLHGGLRHECLTLEVRGDQWIIYFNERGEETGKVEFADEAEACRFFLDKMHNERTLQQYRREPRRLAD